MNREQIFDFLLKEIHTVVMANTDDDGKPVTCAIDIMDYDSQSIYFLTAKGKKFYDRLKKYPFISLTGIKGDSTMKRIAVSVQGNVRECGRDILNKLLERNKYMYDIYPTEQSQKNLTAFIIYEGHGEWFDLSKKPIDRFSFVFGGTTDVRYRYYIDENCTSCKKCLSVCPQRCIEIQENRAVINQTHCLHCGNCFEICPIGAIRRL